VAISESGGAAEPQALQNRLPAGTSAAQDGQRIGVHYILDILAQRHAAKITVQVYGLSPPLKKMADSRPIPSPRLAFSSARDLLASFGATRLRPHKRGTDGKGAKEVAFPW
jgi:hypothetical protein